MKFVRFRMKIGHFRIEIGLNRAISYEIGHKGENRETRPPHPHTAFPISVDLYQQLAYASLKGGLEKEIWEIGASAIREWMVRNDPDSFALPAKSGYQWKHLFLPNGTLLRTIFDGKNYHSIVEDDHICYLGQAISPSGFANAVGGIRRNAWKCIWILFPDTSTWKLAETLRPRNC